MTQQLVYLVGGHVKRMLGRALFVVERRQCQGRALEQCLRMRKAAVVVAECVPFTGLEVQPFQFAELPLQAIAEIGTSIIGHRAQPVTDLAAKSGHEDILREMRAALDAHMKQPHLTAALGQLGDLFGGAPDIRCYTTLR